MKIDFSKFKKIECDEKCTTLEHPNGHTVKIAHHGLSPETKKELDAIPMHLAKGGRAKFSQKFDPNIKGSQARRLPVLPGHRRNEQGKIVPVKGSGASKPSNSSTTMPGSPTEAKDNFTEPQDGGTDVVLAALNKKAPPFGPLGAPEYHSPPCINSSCKSYGHPHPNCRCYGGKMGMYGGYSKGGEVDDRYFCDDNRAHFKDCEYYAKGGGPVGKSSEGEKLEAIAQDLYRKNQVPPEPVDEPQEPQDPTAQSYGPETIPSPAPSPATERSVVTDDINPNSESGKDWEGSYGVAQPQDQAMMPKETPTPPPEDPSTQPAVAPQKQMAPIDQFQQHKNQALNDMHSEVEAFKNDLDKGHIKPETYSDLFDKKSTLGKIGTIFGLLLSGAGSGLAHQPNMLFEMMNKEIQNDLQGQELSASNRQNFLKINQQNLMNKAQIRGMDTETNMKSFALARAHMNYAALHQLVSDTQKLPPGPQKDQAMQALAMMNQGIQNENFNILDRAASASALAKMTIGDSGNNPLKTMFMKSGLLGPEAKIIGEDLEQKTIPGIPGLAQRPILDKDRDQINAMNILEAKGKDLLKFARAHEGTLSPSQRAVAAQKSEEMINYYNASIQGGVLTEGRLKWLDEQIKKNPTSVIAQELLGNNARLEEIINSNHMRRQMKLQSLWTQSPSSKVKNDSEQAQFKMMNGVNYQKVNGGWQRSK